MKHIYMTFLAIGMSFSVLAQQGKSIQGKSKSFIEVDRSSSVTTPQQLLSDKLEMTHDESMVSLKKETDKLGMTHEKFQHYYKGIKVEGSTYTIHSQQGSATHMTGNYRTIDNVDIVPRLSSVSALESAKQASGAKAFAWERDQNNGLIANQELPEGELVIVQNTANGYKSRLAYKYHIIGTDPYVNAYVYIDAETGEVVRYNSIIKHAHGYAKPGFDPADYAMEDDADATGSAATRYSGTQPITTDSNAGSYRLRDYSRGSGVLTWDATTSSTYNGTTGAPTNASEYTDNDNNWTASEYNNSSKDNAALDAHFAAGATYDFFFTNFGRDSYDGSGAAINSYVNTDIEAVFNYPSGYNDNAFWTGYVMVYGKGNSLDPLTTVDITGHEIGHAYCTGTADLVYEKESGAMNEGLSDIWGACVEYYTNTNYGTNKDLWNLGTEIGQTFRSMSNPKAYGDPDTYGGTYWVSQNCTPSSNNDYCGVHTNSGVTNHWFYVMVAGESGTNDVNDTYSVTGIGMDDAAAIVWRTESIYLTTTSDYADFRTYSIQSAVELFGSGSAQEIAVTNAWYAVGVGSEYVVTCSLGAPGNLSSSNVGDNSFTLSWNAVSGADSYTVTVGGTPTNVAGTSYTASGLLSGTQYSCSVVANCATGGNGASSNINVTTTGSAPLNYCASNGNNTSDEYIGRVQLNTIDNSTGASSGGYGDFTTIFTDLTISTQYTITVTPTWTGTVYNEAYSVWIDYNQDGDFADSGEQIWTQSATSSSSVNGSFSVPASATEGATRMRVSMKYNGVPTSCESFTYGEVEDYTVVIGGTGPDTQAPTTPAGLASSNITYNSFDVSWSASTDNVGVTGYNVYLDGALQGTTSSTNYSFTGLSETTSYTVAVSAFDAASNASSQASLNVTTIAAPDTQAPSVPTGLASSNVASTSFDVSWNASSDNVGVTGYNVFLDGSNIGSVTGTSASITGLNPNTSYSVRVSAYDAASNESSQSSALNVTTDVASISCSSTISAPYSEGFESGFGAWTNLGGDDLDWTRRSGSTPSSSTGPSSASEGSYYMYVEASSPNYPSKVTRIESPCFDLSGESTATFSFKYHMYGSNMGTLQLQASTDGTSWIDVWSLSGNQGNSWATANVNMDSYAGATVKLRFVGTTGSSYRGDMAVDDISMTTGGGGGGGSNTVALTIVLDNYPEETSWEIKDGSTVIASGGTYGSQADGSTVVETADLADGCYDFVIYDSYGDGICCSYGSGSYSLTNGGTTLASGGSFGSSETTNFCVGGGAFTFAGGFNTTTVGTPVSVDMYPNPVVGNFLTIVTTREEVTYRISGINGQTIAIGRLTDGKVDVSNLKGGMYMLNLVDAGGKTVTKKFIKQ
jgi:bacillolysin